MKFSKISDLVINPTFTGFLLGKNPLVAKYGDMPLFDFVSEYLHGIPIFPHKRLFSRPCRPFPPCNFPKIGSVTPWRIRMATASSMGSVAPRRIRMATASSMGSVEPLRIRKATARPIILVNFVNILYKLCFAKFLWIFCLNWIIC